jgi:hypothetical protein
MPEDILGLIEGVVEMIKQAILDNLEDKSAQDYQQHTYHNHLNQLIIQLPRVLITNDTVNLCPGINYLFYPHQ